MDLLCGRVSAVIASLAVFCFDTQAETRINNRKPEVNFVMNGVFARA